MSRNNPLTPEILIETIKRSNLPTVLVEGTDDFDIYRNFENKIGVRKVDFIPCGGRNTILEIYKRKSEFLSKKVMYIADKDTWIFNSIPVEYLEIIFTSGYSIENDLFVDAEIFLSNLLTKNENLRLNTFISNVLNWFAFEVDKFLNNQAYDAKFSEITLLNTSVLDRTTNNLTVEFLTNKNFIPPNNNTLNDLAQNYKVKFRGKFIFQLLELIFQLRTKDEIKFHRKQLFNLCFVEGIRDENKNTNINRLLNEIKRFLN